MSPLYYVGQEHKLNTKSHSQSLWLAYFQKISFVRRGKEKEELNCHRSIAVQSLAEGASQTAVEAATDLIQSKSMKRIWMQRQLKVNETPQYFECTVRNLSRLHNKQKQKARSKSKKTIWYLYFPWKIWMSLCIIGHIVLLDQIGNILKTCNLKWS